MGSNPVGDASGGQRQGRGDRRQKTEGGKDGLGTAVSRDTEDAFEKMGSIPAFPRHFINAVL